MPNKRPKDWPALAKKVPLDILLEDLHDSRGEKRRAIADELRARGWTVTGTTGHTGHGRFWRGN